MRQSDSGTTAGLRGYEIDLELLGQHAGELTIKDIYVDQESRFYAFRDADPADIHTAFDEKNMRMISLLTQGSTTGGQYLATFIFKEAPLAPSQYAVTVQTQVTQTVVADPVGCPAIAPQASGLLATP